MKLVNWRDKIFLEVYLRAKLNNTTMRHREIRRALSHFGLASLLCFARRLNHS